MSPTKMGMMDSIADGGKDNDPEGIIQAIPKSKAEDLLEIIRSGMKGKNKNSASQMQMQRLPSESSDNNQAVTPLDDDHHSISIADELRKLADLRNEGEFLHIKELIIRKMNEA